METGGVGVTGVLVSANLYQYGHPGDRKGGLRGLGGGLAG